MHVRAAPRRGRAGGEVMIDVRELQLCLLEIGVPLPRWGADGHLGEETLRAVDRALTAHGYPRVDTPDTIEADEVVFLLSIRDTLRAQKRAQLPPGFIDRRQFATLEDDYGARAWTDITGFTLHQMACSPGTNLDRYNSVGAHFAVLRSERVLYLHTVNRLISHSGQPRVSNGFNKRTIGIELEGRFEGVQGNMKTLWDDPSTRGREQPQRPTQWQIEATKQLMRWCRGEVAAHGGRLTKLLAHRQASSSRPSDPGSECWQEIALPVMAELGLDDGGPGFKVDQGYAIPESWDPRRKGIRY